MIKIVFPKKNNKLKITLHNRLIPHFNQNERDVEIKQVFQTICITS
jgi:hypothetical protein